MNLNFLKLRLAFSLSSFTKLPPAGVDYRRRKKARPTSLPTLEIEETYVLNEEVE